MKLRFFSIALAMGVSIFAADSDGEELHTGSHVGGMDPSAAQSNLQRDILEGGRIPNGWRLIDGYLVGPIETQRVAVPPPPPPING